MYPEHPKDRVLSMSLDPSSSCLIAAMLRFHRRPVRSPFIAKVLKERGCSGIAHKVGLELLYVYVQHLQNGSHGFQVGPRDHISCLFGKHIVLLHKLIGLVVAIGVLKLN